MTTPEEENDRLLSQVARLAHENSARQRAWVKTAKRERVLLRAIARHATGACGCRNERACLVRLSRLVPVKILDEADNGTQVS